MGLKIWKGENFQTRPSTQSRNRYQQRPKEKINMQDEEIRLEKELIEEMKTDGEEKGRPKKPRRSTKILIRNNK